MKSYLISLVGFITWIEEEVELVELSILILILLRNLHFYSNEFYFQVVLPNRSVASPAQMSLNQYTKTQLTDEKTQLMDRKLNSDRDWELIYFKEKMLGERYYQKGKNRFIPICKHAN